MGYQSTRTFVTMNDLLDEAESANVIRDTAIRLMAREVANSAADVSMKINKPVGGIRDACEALRGVLQHIYADD